eukprot:CAMPEP_0202071962 /NCGR_PEP_ID=MMETSP0964-20121228/2127_1 /ASSEMBLY_ACC=CAM_ASM_000500 /TAXON_ID=4773 /ORGANISM="Schizochytrium aggregatum, Strain ATCC28209" /LENGTH=343 /DNA_ID=CAMNT_0048638973 /DNA_START=316 /DNA_END=1345 /DNA_ORIENTATION=+
MAACHMISRSCASVYVLPQVREHSTRSDEEHTSLGKLSECSVDFPARMNEPSLQEVWQERALVPSMLLQERVSRHAVAIGRRRGGIVVTVVHPLVPSKEGAQQTRVVKVLADGNVLRKTFAAASFQEQLARKIPLASRLQRTKNDIRVKGIAWHDAPMVENLVDESLTMRLHAQVRLKSERVKRRNEAVENREWGARNRRIISNVATAATQNIGDRFAEFGRRLYLEEQHGFHHTRRGGEHGRVGHSARGRDDKAGSTVNRLLSNRCVQNPELDISQRLVAKWSLSRGPPESLHNALPHCSESNLVHFTRDRVIQERVWARVLGPERPKRPGRKLVPAEALDE